jgi:hypothetical protein
MVGIVVSIFVPETRENKDTGKKARWKRYNKCALFRARLNIYTSYPTFVQDYPMKKRSFHSCQNVEECQIQHLNPVRYLMNENVQVARQQESLVSKITGKGLLNYLRYPYDPCTGDAIPVGAGGAAGYAGPVVSGHADTALQN